MRDLPFLEQLWNDTVHFTASCEHRIGEGSHCALMSAAVDEFLYYVAGNFTSRKGVGPGSISHHPAGIPHGPHPGAYEASIGHPRTNELAVMLDVFEPLEPTAAALAVEDAAYHASFIA